MMPEESLARDVGDSIFVILNRDLNSATALSPAHAGRDWKRRLTLGLTHPGFMLPPAFAGSSSGLALVGFS
jgi:hypothetical protein